MAKFGELINSDLPILLDFYTDWNETSSSMHPVLRDVAAAIGDKGKVVKINVDKNNELAQALRIKGLPTNQSRNNDDVGKIINRSEYVP